MKKRRILSWLGGIVLLCICLGPTPALCESKGSRIKMATLAPEGSSWMNAFKSLVEEVKGKTGNGIDFKIYPGGILGDERDVLRKMQIGQIQSAALSSGGLCSLYKDIHVFEIPMLFRSYEEVDYILDKMGPLFEKGLEESGYVLLGWSEGGFVYLMSNTPIQSIQDLKKTKVWIWNDSPMSKAIFDEAGIAAVPLSIPDVLVGLQSGMVDVVYAPPTGAISLQWFTQVKYLMDFPLIYMIGGLVVEKDVMDKLPEAHSAALVETFKSGMQPLKVQIRKENAEALQVMAKHGVQILSPDKESVAEFVALSEKAVKRLGATNFKPEILEELKAHLKAYRKGN